MDLFEFRSTQNAKEKNMKCPACDNTLTEINISDILVDICKGGCGGIWFDNFELEKFDEKHEHAGEALLDIERDKNITIDYEFSY